LLSQSIYFFAKSGGQKRNTYGGGIKMNETKSTEDKKQKPLPNQAQSGQSSIGVSWEFEPTEDDAHRLHLIFNLLLNNKLS
jgi:hypothetical protein